MFNMSENEIKWSCEFPQEVGTLLIYFKTEIVFYFWFLVYVVYGQLLE